MLKAHTFPVQFCNPCQNDKKHVSPWIPDPVTIYNWVNDVNSNFQWASEVSSFCASNTRWTANFGSTCDYRRTPGNEFHDVTGQSCTLQIRIWTHMKRPRFLWNVKVWFTSDWGPLQGQKRFLFFFTFHMGSWVSSFKPWKFRHEHFSGLRLKQFRGKIMKSHRHLWLITVHWMDIFCVHVQSRIPILIVSIHIKS